MDERVRDAELGEVDAVRDLYRRSSLSNDGDRPNLLAHPEVLEWSDTPVREHRTRVALRDGAIAGFSTIREVDGVAELDDLFVDPDRQRQGVGRELVADLVTNVRARGIATIEVTANDHALEFYEAVGFVRVGTAETQFGPAVRMRLTTG